MLHLTLTIAQSSQNPFICPVYQSYLYPAPGNEVLMKYFILAFTEPMENKQT
uniref:Uncharacterized protein n=1 Tax=Anguilla anguilla TaxID=7936 RepID=A0A0E9VW32_ANGAN